MPASVYLAYAAGRGRRDALTSGYAALIAAIPMTLVAARLFQNSPNQIEWQAALTVCAALAAGFVGRLPARAAAVALAIVVVRQTMEIEGVAHAAWTLGSRDAIVAIASALVIAALAALAWAAIARLQDDERLFRASSAFAAVFCAQALVYGFHELAEARMLPWSEALHAVSEPFGPEGFYGRGISLLLVAVPFATATIRPIRIRPRIAVALVVAAIAALLMFAIAQRVTAGSASAGRSSAGVAELAASPHLLFRHSGVDADYNKMVVATLDRPSARETTALSCERLSFAMGRGICLQADRRVFTTYTALVFDRSFAKAGSFKIDGSPSRTRVSPDGRVGAITVFVTGHAYSVSGFSTKTTLVDMASAEPIADLEQFTTWRSGARYAAPDVNFWGVTFTRDSNVFYATLGTRGKNYLVKGDLGLRKLTVVHDDLECPSLSPDDRTIVFKRRVASRADAWRLYVLDTSTMTDRPLAAETRYVDDQAEWFDDAHVLYAIPRPDSAVSDVWMAPIDGSAPPRLLIPEANSPIVVR